MSRRQHHKAILHLTTVRFQWLTGWIHAMNPLVTIYTTKSDLTKKGPRRSLITRGPDVFSGDLSDNRIQRCRGAHHCRSFGHIRVIISPQIDSGALGSSKFGDDLFLVCA